MKELRNRMYQLEADGACDFFKCPTLAVKEDSALFDAFFLCADPQERLVIAEKLAYRFRDIWCYAVHMEHRESSYVDFITEHLSCSDCPMGDDCAREAKEKGTCGSEHCGLRIMQYCKEGAVAKGSEFYEKWHEGQEEGGE